MLLVGVGLVGMLAAGCRSTESAREEADEKAWAAAALPPGTLGNLMSLEGAEAGSKLVVVTPVTLDQLVAHRPGEPVILCHPQTATVKTGETATLTVKAQPKPPFVNLRMTYQWQMNKAPGRLPYTNIAGKTNPTLTLARASREDVAFYRVIVRTEPPTLSGWAPEGQQHNTVVASRDMEGGPEKGGGRRHRPYPPPFPHGPFREAISQPASLMVWWPSNSFYVSGTPVSYRQPQGGFVGQAFFERAPGHGYIQANTWHEAKDSHSPALIQCQGPLVGQSCWDEAWLKCYEIDQGCYPKLNKGKEYTFTVYFDQLPVPSAPYDIYIKGFAPP
jgi:hypothetical protein